jgi:hypothetical protein
MRSQSARPVSPHQRVEESVTVEESANREPSLDQKSVVRIILPEASPLLLACNLADQSNHRKQARWQMIQYLCDTCSAVKQPQEAWIVGLAADAVGATSARREVTIQSVWDSQTAVHPLAVHFCSIQCKDEYMTRLFAPGAEAIGHNQIAPELPSHAVMERTIPAKKAAKSKVTKTTRRRSRGAA